MSKRVNGKRGNRVNKRAKATWEIVDGHRAPRGHHTKVRSGGFGDSVIRGQDKIYQFIMRTLRRNHVA